MRLQATHIGGYYVLTISYCPTPTQTHPHDNTHI